jgi:hypothetical protein
MLQRAAVGPGEHPGWYRRAAGVAELADALDLGSSDENRGGSNPPARTSRSALERMKMPERMKIDVSTLR